MSRDELVDVVDENDRVVGKEMKSACHKEGILHRIAAVLLFDSNGRVWLQMRANDETGNAYMDYTASGHVRSGGNYAETASRELEEEVSSNAELHALPHTVRESKDIEGFKIRHAIQVYVGKSDGPFRLQKEELSELKAYDMDKIRSLVERDSETLTEGLRVGLREYLRQKSAVGRKRSTG